MKLKTIFLCVLYGLFVHNSHASNIDVQYNVRILGIRIGTAQVTGEINASTYTLKGNGRITGLAQMVTSGYGEASSMGSVVNSLAVPNQYNIFNTAGKNTNSVKMLLKNGVVSSLSVSPPTFHTDDRLPLLSDHKINIVDPLSTFILPRKINGELKLDECNRVHKIFDGRQRYDIQLYPKEMRTLNGETTGFSGEILICEAQYVPIGGHRSSKKITQYLSENRENELWFAPTADFNALVPIRIEMSTMIGPLVIDAKKYVSQ